MITTEKVTPLTFANIKTYLDTHEHKGFDTETTGKGVDDTAFGLAIATHKEAFYFDMNEFESEKLQQLFLRGNFYAHNAKFDCEMLYRSKGIYIKTHIHCTYIIERLLRNDSMQLSLDATAKRYGLKKLDNVDTFIREHGLYEKKYFDGDVMERVRLYQKVPEPLIIKYAGQDAWLALTIGLKQIEALKKLDKE